MSDLLDKLRRYSEANRALYYFAHGTPEFTAALATIEEVCPLLRVAGEVVTDPEGAAYCVGTMNRECSSVASQHWYAETIVWRGTGDDRELVWQGEAAAGSTATHERAVELVKSGRIEATGEDEE